MKIAFIHVLCIITCTYAVAHYINIKRGLTCLQKNEILKIHNELRQAVAVKSVGHQPGAINMLVMTWDDRLAESAQNWADNHAFKHSPLESRRKGKVYIGENLGITRSNAKMKKTPEFSRPINRWAKEHEEYTFGNTTYTHYTQMVWSKSYLIGCGYTYYNSLKSYRKLYVCHYGPAGNVMDRTPYTKGHGNCSGNFVNSKKYPGLCDFQQEKKNRKRGYDFCRITKKILNPHFIKKLFS